MGPAKAGVRQEGGGSYSLICLSFGEACVRAGREGGEEVSLGRAMDALGTLDVILGPSGSLHN